MGGLLPVACNLWPRGSMHNLMWCSQTVNTQTKNVSCPSVVLKKHACSLQQVLCWVGVAQQVIINDSVTLLQLKDDLWSY